MKLPVYFELDGKFACMLPKPDGGMVEIKDSGSPSIADFMAEGRVIPFDELPDGMKKSITSIMRMDTY
jgi:hypothetical protein